jgi:hypothetical protein
MTAVSRTEELRGETELSLSNGGIIVSEEAGNFVIAPSGRVDISQIEKSDRPASPIRIQRSTSFLITLTNSGRMFVSPAGEVDLSRLNAESHTCNRNRGESLVIKKNGVVSKTNSASTSPTVRTLKRQNRYVVVNKR